MIAIVGMACRFPEADAPDELWRNALGQRQAFRRIPRARLPLDEYGGDAGQADGIAVRCGAFLDGWSFPRERFRIAAATEAAMDPAHWLALAMADEALADAGLAGGRGLPRDSTGVVVGNTLVGDWSRAESLRLRLPYVRRAAARALAEHGGDPARQAATLRGLEEAFRGSLRAPDEESLVGGLANTIAGRICNQFDLLGGCYAIDGACASSLLAVHQACSALAAGDWDAALCGGVDLSIDPFELVGFSRVGALAVDGMRVYDERPTGFLPGEGCGMLVLMRHDDALARGLPVHALIRGWGMSSDGHGSMVRPEVAGQERAIARCYRRAGCSIATVPFFEGHGTGTAVGDEAELIALGRALTGAGATGTAAIGSIKANIGHTKAAAGIAGLIKAVMAVRTRTVPPTTGCERPHALLRGPDARLRAPEDAATWPAGAAPRAGVSAFGFGGINVHALLEGVGSGGARPAAGSSGEAAASAQDCELFVFAGADVAALRAALRGVREQVPVLARSQLGDLAARLIAEIGDGAVRAAVVAASPDELARSLDEVLAALDAAAVRTDGGRPGLRMGSVRTRPRIAFAFPGQGAPAPHAPDAIQARRFPELAAIARRLRLAAPAGAGDTALAQPAIVAAGVAGIAILQAFGIVGDCATGHSLGELTALHWAGAIDEGAAVELASRRGAAMAAADPGAMAAFAIAAGDAAGIAGDRLVLACDNAPRSIVLAGAADEIEAGIARAQEAGVGAVRMAVAHAFHSPAMAAPRDAFRPALACAAWRAPRRPVISSVLGRAYDASDRIAEVLERQFVAAVRFREAIEECSRRADLVIEVGAGRVLAPLIAAGSRLPVASLDVGGRGLRGVLDAVALAWTAGASVRFAPLVGRWTRPLPSAWRGDFLVSPCERVVGPSPAPAPATTAVAPSVDDVRPRDPFAILVALLAERTGLPVGSIAGHHRVLADLHLGSMAVAQVLLAATRDLGLPPSAAPTEYAKATVTELATALAGWAPGDDAVGPPAGVDRWLAAFTERLIDHPLAAVPTPRCDPGQRWILVGGEDDADAERLRRRLAETVAGPGVLAILGATDASPSLLLAAHRAVEASAAARVVVIHPGNGGAWSRALQAELPDTAVCALAMPAGRAADGDVVVAEARAAVEFVDARYDDDGARRLPVLDVLPDRVADQAALGPDDVLLVTGGGKGIAAECALAVARRWRCRLVLLGRAEPGADAALAENLRRIAATGAIAEYARADVADARAVAHALAAARARTGAITAVMHGAGRNEPRLLRDLDAAAMARTAAPKVAGLRHVLAALDEDALRLVVGFGSIIARTGMRGEADYALANEAMAADISAWGRAHPSCRVLTIDWSVWSGTGMAERLGRVEELARRGVTPIAPDEGVRALVDLLSRPTPDRVVVCGRFPETPALRHRTMALPLLRFLERAVVAVPDIEIVSACRLGLASDPYLGDHRLDGQALLPAVMALEAMAQAATPLLPESVGERMVFTDVAFRQAVVVADEATVRVAALRRDGAVRLAIRSSTTGFAVEHVAATCARGPAPAAPAATVDGDALAIEPARDLYGSLLFHGGRFRRVARYLRLGAGHCLAELGDAAAGPWFEARAPQTVLLGDPAARDAALHAVQACIPGSVVLPVRVARVVCAPPGLIARFVDARERGRSGDGIVFDIALLDPAGAVIESWEGLELRVAAAFHGPLHPLLAGIWLERRLRDAGFAQPIAVAVETGGEREERRGRALARLAIAADRTSRRPDGRPEHADGDLSISHCGDLSVAVRGALPVGCDVQDQDPRQRADWIDLLGPGLAAPWRELVDGHGETAALAGARMWTARESLIKCRASGFAPLTIRERRADGTVLFAGGERIVASIPLPAIAGRASLVAAVASP
ncbi:MAG TPA: SDR family NAD(P)-dependent oxidoreductase [Planctomycetota bacterium]|nr:SDR family NAD(P)-dependent oxidoreductase [Planctomycetota bacterium]